jgi:hypothetical protein
VRHGIEDVRLVHARMEAYSNTIALRATFTGFIRGLR